MTPTLKEMWLGIFFLNSTTLTEKHTKSQWWCTSGISKSAREMQNKVAARIKCSNKGRTSRTEIGWESKEKHSQGEGRPVQGRDRENWNFLDTSETLYVTRTLLHFLRLYKQPPKLTFSSSALAVIFVCPQLTRIQSSPFIPTCVRAQSPSCVWLFMTPMDCSPPGSSVHGILQARILEWLPISYFRGSSWPKGWTSVSSVSCISRQIYHCTTWEASLHHPYLQGPDDQARPPLTPQQPHWLS